MTASTNLVHPTPIADLVPMRPALVQGVVVRYDGVCERFSSLAGRSLPVRTVLLRDASGQIELTLWNDQVGHVRDADRVVIVEAWVRVNETNGRPELSLGSRGYLVNLGPASGRGPVWHPDPRGSLYVWGLVRRRLRERDLRVRVEGGKRASSPRGVTPNASAIPAPPPQIAASASVETPAQGGI